MNSYDPRFPGIYNDPPPQPPVKSALFGGPVTIWNVIAIIVGLGLGAAGGPPGIGTFFIDCLLVWGLIKWHQRDIANYNEQLAEWGRRNNIITVPERSLTPYARQRSNSGTGF